MKQRERVMKQSTGAMTMNGACTNWNARLLMKSDWWLKTLLLAVCVRTCIAVENSRKQKIDDLDTSVVSVKTIFQRTVNYKYNHAHHVFTVPDGVFSLNVSLFGADGGGIQDANFLLEGRGGMISAIVPVEPGEVYYVFVGGAGDESSGGYNGGGVPCPVGAGYSGGGGATDLRSSLRLEDRLLVAGGGGGIALKCGSSGGSAGWPVGSDSSECAFLLAGGQGGNQTAGGMVEPLVLPCISSSGVFGQGGNGCISGGAGGGGGYYGGAGSCGGGGGGGSSYSAYVITDDRLERVGWSSFGSATLVYERTLPSGSEVFQDNRLVDWQDYYVPAGVTELHVEMHGSEGDRYMVCPGYMGAKLAANLLVTPGEVLRIFTGCGATDIRRAPYGLAERLLVAGSGGGACRGGHPTGVLVSSSSFGGGNATSYNGAREGEGGLYKSGDDSSYSSVADFSYINGENSGWGYAIVRPIFTTNASTAAIGISASRCDPPEACKADGTCSALYTGENCEECALGMLRVNQKCVSCDAAYGGIVLLAVFVVVYALYIAANKACTEVLLRCYLGIDIVQLLSLLSTVTLTVETPSFVSTAFNALTAIYVNLFLLVSTCLGSPHTDPAMQFQNIFIAVNLLPVAAAMLLYLLCALYRWSVLSYWVALAAVLSLLYCLLLTTSLAVFDCTTTTPDDNYSYLTAVGPMMQGRCGIEGEVQHSLVPWAVTCGILYGLGIPLYLYEVYKYCRRTADESPTNDAHTVCLTMVRTVFWLLCTVVRKSVVLVVLYLTDAPANGDGGRTIGLVVVLVALYISYVGVNSTNLSPDPAAPNDSTTVISRGWLAPQPKQRVLMTLSGIVTVLVLVLSLVNDHDTCLVMAVLLMMVLGVTVLYALCVSTTLLDAQIDAHKPALVPQQSTRADGSLPTDLEAGYAQNSNSPIDIENPMKLRLNSGFSSGLDIHSNSGGDSGNSNGNDGSGGKENGLDAFFSRDIEPGCIENPSEWYSSTIHSGDNNGSYDSDWMGMMRLESGNSSISSEEDLFAPPSLQHTASVNDIIPVPVVPVVSPSPVLSTPNYSEYRGLDSPRYSMQNPWMDSASSNNGVADKMGMVGVTGGGGVVGVAPGDSMVYFNEPTESYGIEEGSVGTVLDTGDSAGNLYPLGIRGGIVGGGDYDVCESEEDAGDNEDLGKGGDEGSNESDNGGEAVREEEVSTALPNMNMRYLTLRHMDTPHRPVHALPSPTNPVQYVEYMPGHNKGNRKW